ncbi:hypothetical protein [Aquimarina sp. 2304DJ70-9]|uniref:hypothetical protein n=1 Tax=Aquimarina penaris TaxID=3231044 RepID=UPI0034622797
MMFRQNYKVKGEDVDDFMIMQDFAYHSYTLSIFNTFLFQKGYSKHKVDTLKMGLQKCKEELIYQQHLMFTQHFSVHLEFIDSINTKQKLSLRSRFFNSENELCVTVNTEFDYLHNNYQELLAPSNTLGGHISMQRSFAP